MNGAGAEAFSHLSASDFASTQPDASNTTSVRASMLSRGTRLKNAPGFDKDHWPNMADANWHSTVESYYAVILSDSGAKALALESAAVDFVRDAFGHLKAIAVDAGGQALLQAAHIKKDAGIVDASDAEAFIAAAKTRQWEREKTVRTLA